MALGSLRELDDWELADDEQDIFGWPVIDRFSASTGTFTRQGPPEMVWQSSQWQTTVRAGSTWAS